MDVATDCHIYKLKSVGIQQDVFQSSNLPIISIIPFNKKAPVTIGIDQFDLPPYASPELPEVEDPRRFFKCRCRSRTSLGRGGCTRTLRDIRERYKMYENATRCTRTLRDVRERYEADGIRNRTDFAKESEAGHLPAGDLSSRCREHLGACIGSSNSWKLNSAFIPTNRQQLIFPLTPHLPLMTVWSMTCLVVLSINVLMT